MDFRTFEKTTIDPTIRHAMTGLGGALVSTGILSAASQATFSTVTTEVVGGAVVWLLGWGWSQISNRTHVAAVTPPAPTKPAV